MSNPRLYTDQPLHKGTEVVLDERAARHAVRVLRRRKGDKVVLFNGNGRDYGATLASVSKERVAARVLTARLVETESHLDLTLAQGIARGNRMDYTLQKAVELGVDTIVPLFCKRTEVRLSGRRLEKRMEHWRGVVISACEQCGRAVLPALRAPMDLTGWLEHPPAGSRLVLRPDGKGGPTALEPTQAATVLIGPEGGLAEEEIESARAAGFQPLRLGPRVLRTETAGPAALAVLQALWGDMG